MRKSADGPLSAIVPCKSIAANKKVEQLLNLEPEVRASVVKQCKWYDFSVPKRSRDREKRCRER